MSDAPRRLFPLGEDGKISRRELGAGAAMGAVGMWFAAHKFPRLAAISPRTVLSQITKANPTVQAKLLEKAEELRQGGTNLGNRIFVAPRNGTKDPFNAVTYTDPNGADQTYDYRYDSGIAIFVVVHNGHVDAYQLDKPAPDVYEKAVNRTGVFTMLEQPVVTNRNGQNFVTFPKTTRGNNLVFTSNGTQIASLPAATTTLPVPGITSAP